MDLGLIVAAQVLSGKTWTLAILEVKDQEAPDKIMHLSLGMEQ